MKNKLKTQNSKLKTKLILDKINYPLYIIVFFIVLFFFNSLKKSLFFQKRDRINLVFYGEKTIFYSLGLADRVNYWLYFYPNLKVKIPGGYGNYRIGALGKLIDLEKQPKIFIKTFSLATSSFVDFYFYPKKTEVYYGEKDEERYPFFLPNLKQLFFYRSNSNFFDRIYIFFKLREKRETEFIDLNLKSTTINSDELFLEDNFAKTYQGYFYEKTYRNEKKTVQLSYTKNHLTADYVSKIIEGTGIRVVDLLYTKEKTPACLVIENEPKFSKTAQVLADFFDCSLKRDKTEISDIILKLGEREGEWEINK